MVNRVNMNSIKYTLEHRKAFLMIEKKLLGKNTIRGLSHDFDKVFLKLIFDKNVVQKIHRNFSRHHKRARTKADYIQMIIDWECARFTKPDKPLNAKETLYKYYPELIAVIEPLLTELGL